ncbi:MULTISPECIES: protein-L-isoaspartate O-methyltransferase family protein [Rhizobium]|uniref:Protein-L-isoaspartate O-methyltransferase n=1 Tax=Rhizobium miluonense TaxID=411945 RepID=A0A1C3WKS6_9HYPH|nr:methyltransferase domain-containing protein [Rhizobium miluonense]SCB40580.1 protein-L-isoaspartate(D-aspartate) O-methyltransferase [Rhizobium miluonense]
MTAGSRASLDEIRAFHAKMMAAASNSSDERLEQAFNIIRREAFMGPGPWQIVVNRRYLQTPGDDPAFLYQNVLVALDRAKGINNGEPFLHAAFIGAVAPGPGETVIHIGTGTGYYTALLSTLVAPGGHVYAIEIDRALAKRTRKNLASFEGISVIHGDATSLELPDADLIYVNAGVVAPPVSWLQALRPGGRIIIPWHANDRIGLAVRITRTEWGYDARALMPAYFIPCVGASDPAQCSKVPTVPGAWSIRSVWLTRDRAPDDTAVAIYRDLWFSDAFA